MPNLQITYIGSSLQTIQARFRTISKQTDYHKQMAPFDWSSSSLRHDAYPSFRMEWIAYTFAVLFAVRRY